MPVKVKDLERAAKQLGINEKEFSKLLNK